MLWGLMLRDARLGLVLVWSGLVLTHPLPCCLVFFVVGLRLALVLVEWLLLLVGGGPCRQLPPLVFLALLG